MTDEFLRTLVIAAAKHFSKEELLKNLSISIDKYLQFPKSKTHLDSLKTDLVICGVAFAHDKETFEETAAKINKHFEWLKVMPKEN